MNIIYFFRVMRLLVLFSIVGFMHVSAGSYSQTVTLKGTAIPFSDVMKTIRQQTGYAVYIDADQFNSSKPVTIQVSAMPVQEFLTIVLKDQPFTYKIEEKTIFILKKPIENTIYSNKDERLDTPSQQQLLTGRIVDSTGTGIRGVTMRIVNAKKGTFTDAEGRFSLSVNEGDIVSVSSVGFLGLKFRIDPDKKAVFISSDQPTVGDNTGYQNIPKERAIVSFVQNTDNGLLITLVPNISSLNDVEVTISNGYQNLNPDRATGSFTYVNKELLNRRVSTDVISKLEGIVPGMLFNRNTQNAATGRLDINIRGHNTLYANDQPLIVLDGYPYNGDINNINPITVESITILKDAAAASIWGVKSGNGVIVIRTKKGFKNQKLNVEVNTNLTMGEKPDIFYNPNFLDSKDFIDVEKYLFTNGYYNARLRSKYQVVSPVVQSLADARSGKITTGESDNFINSLSNLDVRNDIEKYYYQKSANQQYGLNVSGGGENNDYFLTVGYDKNNNSLKGNGYDRITLGTNYNYYPIKNLQFNVGVNYTKSKTDNNSSLSYLNVGDPSAIYPYAQLKNADGTNAIIQKDFSQRFKDSVLNLGFLDWNYKPLDEINRTDSKASQIDSRIILGVQYTLPKGFSIEVKYQYQRSEVNNNTYNSDSTYATRSIINRFTNFNSSNPYPVPKNGILNASTTTLASQNFRSQLNFNSNWSDRSKLTALIGGEVNQTVNEGSSLIAYGYDRSIESNSTTVDYFTYFPTNPGGSGSSRIPNNQGFYKSTDHFLSYYGNASYIYLNRYIGSISGRIDKSNLFGVKTNQKAVPLYSTGLSWLVQNESFYHINWLPLLKIRATYGYNGNINKSATALPTISRASGSAFNSLDYAVLTNPGNPELRWEKTRMFDLGVDYALKNQFISGSFDFYFKRGIDLFGYAPLAPSAGYPSILGNSASTSGKGMDLVLNTKNIESKYFKWNTTFLFSYTQDRLRTYATSVESSTTLLNLTGVSSFYPIKGNPIFGIYSFKSLGLTHDTGETQGLLNGKASTDYTNIIQLTSQDSLKFNGSARPTTFGSLRNTFSYGQLSVSFNIIYKLNYFFRRSSINYGGLYSGWVGNKDFKNRWQSPGDESHTSIPSMSTLPINPDRDRFYQYSDALVEKGDHIRLQDISLSYKIMKAGHPLVGFTNLELYGYVNNVGIIWRANKKGLDPDLYGQSLPAPKTYSLGVRANF